MRKSTRLRSGPVSAIDVPAPGRIRLALLRRLEAIAERAVAGGVEFSARQFLERLKLGERALLAVNDNLRALRRQVVRIIQREAVTGRRVGALERDNRALAARISALEADRDGKTGDQSRKTVKGIEARAKNE